MLLKILTSYVITMHLLLRKHFFQDFLEIIMRIFLIYFVYHVGVEIIYDNITGYPQLIDITLNQQSFKINVSCHVHIPQT